MTDAIGQRARYWGDRAHGRCAQTGCGNPAAGGVRCASCRDRRAKAERARRATRPAGVDPLAVMAGAMASGGGPDLQEERRRVVASIEELRGRALAQAEELDRGAEGGRRTRGRGPAS